ncbi:MAG: HEAT repeat domain-containing protein [Cyanothece sp. SIO1E1]|nr:HEAT repeat domain-containing protein [Cyanothece sp. SIO1E1]
MAKSRKLEALLEQLKQLRSDPTADNAVDQLRQILGSKYAVAVAQAAKITGQYEITQLTPELITAFKRFMINPVKSDPNCLAKAGIADALYRMNYSDAELFLQGIHHVQMEPAWGEPVDTAPELRGICAMGLVRMNYPAVMIELADLLADPELPVRIAAAQAIAYSESEHGIPLLRLRAKMGDQPEVISECLVALLKLAPERSLDFVASFLQAEPIQTQELVALALGESRLPEAFDRLRYWWAHTTEPELRQTGLLAIAMLRQDATFQFLVSLIATGRNLDAKDAIAALSIYRHDPGLWQRVHAAAEKRGDAELLKALQKN